MLSAQCDELRQMADGQATYRDARAVMLEAADTIWQLRDDLQRANAENDRLRELVKDMVLNIGGCALHGNPLRLREFGSRAKELGIEVDG